MTAVSTAPDVEAEPAGGWLPRGRPWVVADLEQRPDDGHRYELLDGLLIVSAASRPAHQSALAELFVLLRAACPKDLKVLIAPLDVVLAEDTVLQPDVLVARRADLTDRNLPAAPLLAVEVLSPSTRRLDLTLKRDRYAAAGCPSYWVVDPDGPSLTAWDLHDGSYVEVAHTTGEHAASLEFPFPVTVVPARLLD